jgi:hypothetical protein
LLIKGGLSTLLVAIILSQISVAEVTASIAAASTFGLTLALLAFLLIPFLGGLRWYLALRGLGSEVRLSESIALFSSATVVGQVLPGPTADGVRVWLAMRRGHAAGTALQSVLLERLAMVLALLLQACLMAPHLANRIGESRMLWLSPVLLLCGLAGFILLAFADRVPAGFANLTPWNIVAAGAAEVRRLSGSRWGARLAGTSLLGNLNFAFAAFLLARSLGIPASLLDIMAIMPAVTLASTMPISLGGWGVRETALVMLLGRIGVAAPQALALSILFGAFGIVAALPGALVWALCRRPAAPTGALHAAGVPRAMAAP